MSVANPSPPRLLPADQRRQAWTPGAGWLLPSSVLAGLVLLLAVGSVLSSGRRAMQALPPGQRAALLSHTVSDLRLFCGDGRVAALEDHCRELATFAARFDECRGECETLVRRQLAPIPTR